MVTEYEKQLFGLQMRGLGGEEIESRAKGLLVELEAVAVQDLRFVARNIVNQILDEAGTDMVTRQRINDGCDRFVIGILESLKGD